MIDQDLALQRPNSRYPMCRIPPRIVVKEINRLVPLEKKMKLHISTDESSGSSDDDNETEVDTVGYRLVDLKNLSSVLCTVHKCKEGGFTIYKACDYYIKVAPVSFTFH